MVFGFCVICEQEIPAVEEVGDALCVLCEIEMKVAAASAVGVVRELIAVMDDVEKLLFELRKRNRD